jgi:RNA-directed DNA polymerase
MRYATPSRILSRARLLSAWQDSRDATKDPGRPGIDDFSALQFSSKLETNIASLTKAIRDGNYGRSRLKAILIPKPNSITKRLICIPTVKDRLVQRAIIEYLVRMRKLPDNPSSYGFTRGRGTGAAISRAIELRGQYDWCIKTDIEAFFDRVPRDELKTRVKRALPRCSLVPLINKVIDCEIRETRTIKSDLAKQGIRFGVGLRQGMPLSPILANLALSEFDNEIQSARIPMIRYADDILLFFRSKENAEGGLAFVKWRLKKHGFDIPELSDNLKTRVVPPKDALDFLGREIVYLGSQDRYVSRISRRQIAKIRAQLEEQYSFESRLNEQSNFQETVVDLSKSVAAYLGIYKDTYNFPVFDSELRAVTRAILVTLFEDIFGTSILNKVTDKGRTFLGIGTLAFPDPSNELEDIT